MPLVVRELHDALVEAGAKPETAQAAAKAELYRDRALAGLADPYQREWDRWKIGYFVFMASVAGAVLLVGLKSCVDNVATISRLERKVEFLEKDMIRLQARP